MNKLIIIIFIIILLYFVYIKRLSENFKDEISYDDLNTWSINKDYYLFFDLFARNDELIFISTAYDFYEIDFDSVNIKVNGADVEIKDKHDFIEYEPCVIRIYDISKLKLNNELINVEVKYKNEIRNFKIKYKTFIKKYNLILTTLFKDDDYLLKTWLNYYKKNGVEHFYLYINKPLTKKYMYKNTNIIQWDFHYWNKKENYSKKKKNLRHHSQVPQINHAVFKYAKPLSKWVANIDLDEFLYIENNKIASFLNDKYNKIIFRNYFSRLDNNYKPRDDETLELYKQDIYISKHKSVSPPRTKFISKSDNIICNGIHDSKKFKNEKKLDNNKMIHFSNWTKKNRTFDSINLLKIRLK